MSPWSSAERLAGRLARALWGLWATALFCVVVGLLWPLVVFAPSRSAAWRAARAGGRFVLFASGMRVSVSGLAQLRALSTPCVFVANHSSEADALLMAVSLPVPFAFVAKDELRRSRFLRRPLERLGTLFVRRNGPRAGTRQTDLAAERLRAGESLMFFPEGTFRRVPGLLPFHRGAFVAAARAGLPVVPIAIRGARAITSPVRLPPRRSAVEIEIGAPLEAPRRAAPATAAAALRWRARAFVLAHCGERERGRGGYPPRRAKLGTGGHGAWELGRVPSESRR